MSAPATLSYYKIKSAYKWWKYRLLLSFLSIFTIWYIYCLPDVLFEDSTSTVLLDKNGELLGAHISKDQQWRFQESKTVPYKFRTCIVQFEDRSFYGHYGVSARGIGRAIKQNLSSGKRVSGGSTITMQLVRLMRKNPNRTYREKILEMLMATRLEMRYSKKEILRLYSSHAPFGSNVVGLNAAAWRYYGRPAHKLSWSESATLAVLPNAPGLIFPGKNHNRLRAKRNRLLKYLRKIRKIGAMEYEMALLEPLPDRPLPLPNLAPHLLNKCISSGHAGKTIRTTVDKRTQIRANDLLENHVAVLRENRIYNGAVMITSVKTGEIVAYVGNAFQSGREHSNQVNCIDAPRSTGSILKPLLYAKSLEAGIIAPKSLLPDIPSKFGSFAPKNYNGGYDGLVPANKALSQSLNIPMVHLLKRYGTAKFRDDLNDLGFTTIHQSARHYGLSLILGGAEVNLNDLSQVYTRMAQRMQNSEETALRFVGNKKIEEELKLDRGCIYSTINAMLEVKRPDAENNWRMYSSSRKIAWKTGTSFGFRDAWAVGVTPDYVVTVWMGNADGEGRPGLTGVQAAAPLLFDLFNYLPEESDWFEEPESELQSVEVCEESGHRATRFCSKTYVSKVPKTTLESQGCPYHTIVHLDKTGQFRVDADCASPSEMQHESWFVIPSSIENYYRRNHPNYTALPPFKEECMSKINEKSISVVYPKNGQKIYIPFDFSEQQRKIIFEATHRSDQETIYWHMDGVFIGQTAQIHQLQLRPSIGKHKLTIMDGNGVKKEVRFSVVR